MKAIEYYNKLKESKTSEEFKDALTRCLKDLVYDADKLIKVRRATSNEAVRKCVLEVNDKWLAIINLYQKDKNIDPESPLWGSTLYTDGFKNVYLNKNPNRGWLFDKKDMQTRMDTEKRTQAFKNADESIEYWKNQDLDITNPTLILYGLKPYNEFTELNKSEISRMIIRAFYILGDMSNDVMSGNMVSIAYSKIIAKYVYVLRAWMQIERIEMGFKNMAYEEINVAIMQEIANK